MQLELWGKQVFAAAAVDERWDFDTITKDGGQKSGCASSKWAGWPVGYGAFRIVKSST